MKGSALSYLLMLSQLDCAPVFCTILHIYGRKPNESPCVSNHPSFRIFFIFW